MKQSITKRLMSLALALSLVLSLAPVALALDGDEGDGEDGGGTPPTPVTLTDVSIQPSSFELKVGETQTVTAQLAMSDGSTVTQLPEGATVQWEVKNSRDEVIVTPTSGSLSTVVEAVRTPETTESDTVDITVTVTLASGGGTDNATCSVKVFPSDPQGVTIQPGSVELSPLTAASNHTQRVTATVTPSTADQTVTWRTADSSVATVAPVEGTTSAIITGVKVGETKVYASTATKETSCTVTVQGVVLDKAGLASHLPLRVGDRYLLNHTIYGDSLQTAGVTWTSSDTSVLRVDSGYLYAVKEGTATVKVQVNGFSDYSDTVEVKVERNTADVISTSASTGNPLSFSSISYRLQNCCSSVLGKPLSYISGLSVPTDQGTLYYRYTSSDDTGNGVATGDRLYLFPGSGQLSLSEVTFVPKGDFSGTAVINYTGYASGTEFFQGTIEVSVAEQQDVTYSTANGTAVQLDAYDFAVICRSRTSRDLSYISFTLPDSSVGTLYYNYFSPENPGTEVRASTQYKYAGSPGIGDVYFVPASGFDGRAVISYTGWNTNRESYQGRLIIQVAAGTDTGSVQYAVAQGELVTFDDSDFNSLSRKLTGYSLDCVRFTLPSAAQGTLYYNYKSTTSSERVSATRSYYRNDSPYLDNVSFLASDSYTGNVAIPFTGWTTNGGSFSGTVSIRVGGRADAIRYKGTAGKEVEFQSGDFNDVCLAATGSSLQYVRFTSLPAASRGTLYYDYDDGDYNSKVTTSHSYYRSSSLYLSRVSFVPSTSFSGTVSIPFTGWSTGGERFDGTVEVSVSAGSSSDSTIIYTTAYDPVTFSAADFRTVCDDRDQGSLVSVEFTSLPSASAGRLYRSYSGFRSANTEVRTGTKYYPSKNPNLSDVTFVPKVGYQGAVWISYTGTDSKGKTYQGRVQILVTPRSYSAYFTDLSSSYTWAAASVDFLYENGVVTGTGGSLYSPAKPITRGEFVTMVDRALALPHTSQQSFTDVSSGSYYAASVQAACALGIVNGYGDGTFRPNSPITRADAMTMLYRAMQVMGWGLSGSTSALSYYSDGSAVPSYAREAMAAMVQNGIITGTSAGKLEPAQVMTRAEMAVALARALTI